MSVFGTTDKENQHAERVRKFKLTWGAYIKQILKNNKIQGFQ